jgi:Leucine-rich repeat (LRR) protein
MCMVCRGEVTEDTEIIDCRFCNTVNCLPDFKYKSLTHLQCQGSNIERLPDFSYCTELEFINCFSCTKLTFIPDLLNCRKLNRLCVSDTKIETIPDLSNCEKLKVLSVAICKLTSFPNISNCKSLQYLCFYDCSLDIPFLDFSEYKALETLFFSYNKIWKIKLPERNITLECEYCTNLILIPTEFKFHIESKGCNWINSMGNRSVYCSNMGKLYVIQRFFRTCLVKRRLLRSLFKNI